MSDNPSNVRSLADRAKRKGSETVMVKLSDLSPLIEELDELRAEIEANKQLLSKVLRLFTGLLPPKQGH
jgi:hypothetical protein